MSLGNLLGQRDSLSLTDRVAQAVGRVIEGYGAALRVRGQYVAR